MGNTKLHIVKDRRRRARMAPSFPSRKGQRLVEGLTKTELILKYSTQVRLIAQRIARDLPQSIELDDLVSMGFIGLMDAADRYDPSHGAKFQTYSEFRIRGAIIDSLREQDWVPRSVRDRAKSLERAQALAEKENGTHVTETEVSKILGVGVERYQQLKHEVGSLALINVGDETEIPMQDNGYGSDPYTETSRKITKEYFDKLLGKLSDNERLVLSCYYYRGLNLREISHILAVTESRVSQIHAQAIYKLKDKIKNEFPNTQEMFVSLLAA